jgi:hypothetical protein
MRSRFGAFAHITWAIVFVFATLLVPMSASSQESRGKISGRVTDPNGAAVPGASVKITDLARAGTTTCNNERGGRFDAPYLLPGTYQVLVEVPDSRKRCSTRLM